MGDMHTSGAKLTGQRLGNGPLGELARSKIGKFDAAAQRGRSARDDECGRVRRRGVYTIQEEGEGCLGEVEEAMAV